MPLFQSELYFFFFNDTATTEIYTLSLHDALPICQRKRSVAAMPPANCAAMNRGTSMRSEEHTSELQSQSNLVCRLLLEKKKNKINIYVNCESNLRSTLYFVSLSYVCLHSPTSCRR